MTKHGNIRSYLHRLKIIGSPECPCKHCTQTLHTNTTHKHCTQTLHTNTAYKHYTQTLHTYTAQKHCIQTLHTNTAHKQGGHLIFQCKRLKNERENLKNSVLKVGNWPVSKSELTNRNLKKLIGYTNPMDLETINHSNEQM
jgi:hypothetical protein